MNKEQLLHKKYPLRSSFIVGVVLLLVGAVASLLISKSPPVAENSVTQIYNNFYITTYTIENKKQTSISGSMIISANEYDALKSVNVIKGKDHVVSSDVQEKHAIKKVVLPPGAIVEMQTVSGNVVAPSFISDNHPWYKFFGR